MTTPVWKLIEAGVYMTHYREHLLRCRWTKTGWLISRETSDGWQFIAGDVKRDDAERKAFAWLGAK